MKKVYFSFLALIVVAVSVDAQTRQFVLFEHFTQASCGPCASQNPPFQEDILNQNRGNVHHIAYHTSWPGVDPMNADNPVPVQNRVDYYGVTGVPDMIMNGEGKGSPLGVVASDVTTLNAQDAPIKVKVTETGDAERSVSIEVITTGDISGEYTLQTAVVERDVVYASPPGNNGEKDFPNVFRATLNSLGTDFSLAEQGQAVTFDFDYMVDDNWNAEEVYVIAYVQDDNTKQILNSGSSDDPTYSLYSTDKPFKSADLTADFSTFSSSFYTGQGGYFNVKLISNQPEDWEAMIDVDGQTTENEMLFITNADEEIDINLNISPSITPGITDYTIEITSLDDAQYNPQRLKYNFISNIWDLVVTNDASLGDYGPFDVLYVDGLEATDNKYVGKMGTNAFIDGMNNDALGDVKNIYFNVRWSFPSLTDDKVAAFKTFLDNGGNMLIAGQDIGWETSADGYFTAATLDFYENYMHAEFIDDGGVDRTTLTANPNDDYFGGVPQMQMEDIYGGNYYPDAFNPTGGSVSILTYNEIEGETLTGAVRYENETFKTVYLGVGLEMLESSDAKLAFMEAVHDFFYAGEEEDPTIGPEPEQPNAIIELDGLGTLSVQPNPASDFVNLSFDDLSETIQITFFDLTGKVIANREVAAGTNELTVTVQNWVAGAYFYQVNNASGILANGKLIVK